MGSDVTKKINRDLKQVKHSTNRRMDYVEDDCEKYY
jgi:hypothetical protein